VINSKLAAYSKGGAASRKDLDFGTNDWRGAEKVAVVRGVGGIQISYGFLSQGDVLDVISKDPSGAWWISNDTIVPEGELAMRSTSVAEMKTRFANGP
jgi:hypothetical protein